MKINLTCQCCNKQFETDYKFRDKKFCSRACYFQDVRNGKATIGRHKDINVREVRQCKVCDTEFEVRKKEKKTMCSDECRLEWSKMSENKDKLKKSIKEGVLNKYGVDHVWKVKEIHQKTMANRDRDLSIEKQKNTVRENHLKKLLPRLKENNLHLLDKYSRNKNGNTSLSYNFNCLVCNTKFQSTLLGSGIIPTCPNCTPNNKNTSIEFFITNFLNENNIEYITNTRKIISPLELDIFIPKHNVAIELNGMYWHGELNGKNRNYHLNKTKECHNKQIRLLHILDEEIINSPKIIISKLRNILGLVSDKIYARKCVIREVDNKTKKDFLIKNHIQGDTKDKIRLGLYHQDELVSVMTFAKRKITKGDSTWEITRFASKLDCQVVGGFSKLFKHFLNNYEYQRIVTFADLRWSSYDQNNTVYFKNGFTYNSHTPPSYWYFYRSNNDKKFHRYNFRKNVLVNEGFDPSKTEWEIMQERGFDRLWDCGNIKFTYQK
jgi:hypothetical protein